MMKNIRFVVEGTTYTFIVFGIMLYLLKGIFIEVYFEYGINLMSILPILSLFLFLPILMVEPILLIVKLHLERRVARLK